MGSEIDKLEDEIIRLRSLVINLEGQKHRLHRRLSKQSEEFSRKYRPMVLANYELTKELDEQRTINTQQGMLIDLMQHVLFKPVHNSKITS